MIQWLLVIQLLLSLFWLNGITVSSSVPATTWTLPTQWVMILRGGDSDEDDISAESTTGTTTNTDSDNEEQSTEDFPVTDTYRKKPLSGGPFRLLQEVRQEVLTHRVEQEELSPQDNKRDGDDDEDDDIITTTNNNDDNSNVVDQSTTTRTTKSLVGGAAVAKERNLVGAPVGVDTNRVAPLSLRLLQESTDDDSDDDEEEEVAVAPQESMDTKSHVARLWWVNVWTQQLSDMQTMDDVKKKKKKNDEDSEEDSTSSSGELIEGDENIKESRFVLSEPLDKIDNTDIPIDDGTRRFDDGVVLSETSDSFVSSGLVSLSITIVLFWLIKQLMNFHQWVPLDNLFTLGLASNIPSLRLSTKLRGIRKMTARATGLHGFLSGKPSRVITAQTLKDTSMEDFQRRVPASETEDSDDVLQQGQRRRRRGFGFGRFTESQGDKDSMEDILAAEQKRREEEMEVQRRQQQEAKEEEQRMKRVKEIDRLIAEGQARLQHLICEKDVLQRRPNPLFNYTIATIKVDENKVEEPDRNESDSQIRIEASRKFKFPPDDLVEEYLDMAFSSRRIAKMNHTYLWQDTEMDNDDDESIGDDLLTPSIDAHKLYQDFDNREKSTSTEKQTKVRNGGGGSWILRQTLGKGPSIGEKIGEVAETAAYKAVCAAVMSFLARALSSLHGVNVMKHSDIRLLLEQAPDLPRVGEGIIPGSSSDYAQETIKTVIRRKARKSKKRSKYAAEDSFVQRDAVTEMLLSHVQISAPLLKLFPLAWQRAFLGNIITLSTAIMADFFEGLQFQILGHSLSFAFTPITQEDMINHLGLSGSGFNRRRAKAEEFEAAVRATAEDIGEELKFLDRWHERALGSGVLRTQIANLIARIVLTLTDEVLSGARMDLWSAQAGGPRMLAGLEYRAT